MMGPEVIERFMLFDTVFDRVDKWRQLLRLLGVRYLRSGSAAARSQHTIA